MAQRQRRGFSLLEIAIALTIIGLLTAGAAQMLTTLTVRSQEQTTKQRIEEIEAALVRHFARECRLPCPADATLDASDSNAGKEDGSGGVCGTDSEVSAVPWKTLGITRSKTFDGWNRRIRYRPASNELTETSPVPLRGLKNVADGYPCEGNPGGSGKNLTEWIEDDPNRGLTVEDKSGTPYQEQGEPTAAAFVLVSHGQNGLGAYSRGGSQIGYSSADEEERKNADNNNIFVRRRRTSNNADPIFDDIFISMTIDQLAQEVGVYPVSSSGTSGGSGGGGSGSGGGSGAGGGTGAACPGGGAPPCGKGPD